MTAESESTGVGDRPVAPPTLTASLSSSDYLFKLLLIGDSGVGKSCLLLRFAVSDKGSPAGMVEEGPRGWELLDLGSQGAENWEPLGTGGCVPQGLRLGHSAASMIPLSG